MANIVSLVVRLVDQVSSAAPKVVRSVQGIANAAESIGKRGGSVDRAVNRLAAVSLAANGLQKASSSLKQFLGSTLRGTADFDDELQGVAQTGGLTAQRLQHLRNEILALAPILGRTPGDITDGLLSPFIAAGVDDVTAEKLLAPLGRIAVGQRAALKDISDTGIALVKNLKIPVEQIERTFDGLAQAGKLGRFELKDMARYMPSVAAMAANVGMTGRTAALELAAALQITRDAAGGPAQAATNLQNLLQKLQSPETVKKFDKVGIDIKSSIDKGLKAGRSPLETIIVATQQALAKNKSLTLGDLFSDMQVQQALGPLVRQFDEFKRIRAEASEAANVIATDFDAMSKTAKASFDQLAASSESLSRIWGQFLAPAATAAARAVASLSQALQKLMTDYPTLSRIGAYGAAGIVVLAAAVTSVGSAVAILAGAVALLKVAGLGGVLAGIAKVGIGALAALFFWLVRLPAAIIAGVIQGLVLGLAPFMPALAAVLLRGLAALFGILTGPVGWAILAATIAWQFREQLMQAFRPVGEWMLEIWERIRSSIQGLNLADVGAQIIASLLSGLQSAAESVISWATGFVGRLKSLFSFSASPSIRPNVGGGLSDGAPTAIPQSAPGGLAPAPRMRQASYSVGPVTIHVDGNDPERAARQIVTALDRYRQGGLYDGAPA